MTPEEAEEYVRARWESAEWTMGPDPWTLRISCPRYFDGTQHECWLAAAEYTKQREEEIRQKREEIHWMRVNHVQGDTLQERILAVLESQLASLLVGWKETP